MRPWFTTGQPWHPALGAEDWKLQGTSVGRLDCSSFCFATYRLSNREQPAFPQ